MEKVKKTYLYIIDGVWFRPLKNSQDMPDGLLRGTVVYTGHRPSHLLVYIKRKGKHF